MEAYFYIPFLLYITSKLLFVSLCGKTLRSDPIRSDVQTYRTIPGRWFFSSHCPNRHEPKVRSLARAFSSSFWLPPNTRIKLEFFNSINKDIYAKYSTEYFPVSSTLFLGLWNPDVRTINSTPNSLTKLIPKSDLVSDNLSRIYMH